MHGCACALPSRGHVGEGRKCRLDPRACPASEPPTSGRSTLTRAEGCGRRGAAGAQKGRAPGKNDAGAPRALGRNADLCYRLSAGQGLYIQFPGRALGRCRSREAPRSEAPSLTRATTEAILDAGLLEAFPARSGRVWARSGPLCCSASASLARRPQGFRCGSVPVAARRPLLPVPLSTARPAWARSGAVSRGASDSSLTNGARPTTAASHLRSLRRPFDLKSLSFLN